MTPSEKGGLVARKVRMDELVLIGVVRKVRGNKGDLKVESMSDIPERFSKLENAFVRKRNSVEAVKMEIEKSESVNDYAVIKLKGVDSYEGAEAFLGAELLVPESERAVPPEGAYFVDSLIGMTLKNLAGEKIGVVADLLSNSRQNVLTIRMDNGFEFDLPFVSAFIKGIDEVSREITVELIEGIIEDTMSKSQRHVREN